MKRAKPQEFPQTSTMRATSKAASLAAKNRTHLCHFLLALGLSGALVGCGGAAARPAQESLAALHTPRRLFPMGEGYSWAFRNDPGGGLPVQTSVLRVTSVRGTQAQIESLATGDARTYDLREDGLFWVDANLYLIHTPIRVGTSWPSSNARTATITEADVAVDVPTGHFDHCIVVTEEGGTSGLTVRTTYCPDVGPTIVATHQTLQLVAAGTSTRSELQAYQQGEDE